MKKAVFGGTRPRDISALRWADRLSQTDLYFTLSSITCLLAQARGGYGEEDQGSVIPQTMSGFAFFPVPPVFLFFCLARQKA